ncbi:hypothetical protein FRC03_003199 [Tulasnella sp. 419]|nr:hypothetical protein FRC03_003199 [Tulasnella sp. 419]
MTDNSSITKKLREPHPADSYAGFFQVKDPGNGPFYIWDPKTMQLRRNDHGEYITVRWDHQSLEHDRDNRTIQRDHVFEIQYVLKLFGIHIWEEKVTDGSLWFPPDALHWINSIVNRAENVVIVPTLFHTRKTSFFKKGGTDAMSKDIFHYLLDCQKLFNSHFGTIKKQLQQSNSSTSTKIFVENLLDQMEQTPWCKPDMWTQFATGKPWSLPGLVDEQSQTKLEESSMLPAYSKTASGLIANFTHKGGCECMATMDKPHSRHRTVAVILAIAVSLNVATIFAIHVIHDKQRLSASF